MVYLGTYNINPEHSIYIDKTTIYCFFAMLSYHSIEKPFMELRVKYFKSESKSGIKE